MFLGSTIPFLGTDVLTHSAIVVFVSAPGKFSLEPDDIDLGEADQQDPFAPLDQLYRMEKVKLPGSIPVTVGCLWCSILFNGFLRFSILKQRFCRWPLQVEASTDEQCLHGGPAGEDGISWLGVTKSGCIAYLQLDQVGKSRKRDKYKCPSKSNASLYYIILYYIILYYIILYYILCYIILYHILYIILY